MYRSSTRSELSGTAGTARATLARRGVARLVDGAVVAAAATAVGAATGFGLGWLIGTSIAIYAYFVAFDTTGATPGKRVLGLRVESVDTGRPPTFDQALRRELFVLAGAVPFVGPILALVAWVTIARGIAATGTGWHDRHARSTVTTSRS